MKLNGLRSARSGQARAGLVLSIIGARAPRVSHREAEPGDVILTPSPDGARSGHMGIYSGDDDAGRSWGNQMGEHGAAEVPWKGNPQYYRPSTIEDLEGRIRNQLEELSPRSPPAGPSGSSGSSCSGCAIPAL
jgi:hypothetical protein